jgi:hypothetical protein
MTAGNNTNILQKLLQEKMICHASGDTTKRFVVGYYMYHMLPQKKDKGIDHCLQLNSLFCSLLWVISIGNRLVACPTFRQYYVVYFRSINIGRGALLMFVYCLL